MNNVLTNDKTTINNNGEICIRKLGAFYNMTIIIIIIIITTIIIIAQQFIRLTD